MHRALGFDVDLQMLGILLALCVALVVASLHAARDPAASPLTRAVPRVVLVAVLALVLALTLQPRAVPIEAVNIVPLRSFARYLAGGVDLVLAMRNLVFNVLLFVPYGLVRSLQRAMRGHRRTVVLVTLESLALSVCIEVVQLLAPLGRVADVDDVLTNGLGGLLGAVAGVALVGVLRALAPGGRTAREDPLPVANGSG